jgi:LPS-assembly lipoprotein
MRPVVAGRRALLGGIALALAGCGFELRRAPELRFKTIALTGFKARSPVADELRTSLATSTTTVVVDSPAEAQVVLQALDEVSDKSVVASTSAAQVRDYQLRARFNFVLRNSAGKELIPATEILQTRDLSYSESVALAKEQEEGFLFRAMQRDIAAQVVRRLAALQGF